MPVGLELVEGHIHDRRKRFLADVELPGGERVVAHLANTGRMTGCWAPGARCRLSLSTNPKRKLAWSVEQILMDDWILVNTARPNQLVAEALPALFPLADIRREVPFPEGGRVDFRVDETWLEVKNATLLDGPRVIFPDTVTERGLRHLQALHARRAAGEPAVLFFVVGHQGATSVAPAWQHDPAWCTALGDLPVLAHGVQLTHERMVLAGPLPFEREQQLSN